MACGSQLVQGLGRPTNVIGNAVSLVLFLTVYFGTVSASWQCFSLGAARNRHLSSSAAFGNAIRQPPGSANLQHHAQVHAAIAGLCSAGVALVAVCRNLARQPASSTSIRAFENELGVQPPLGFWDPLGFTEDGDVSDFFRRREAELKNGRVAMFATMGYIAPEWTRWPGYASPSTDLKFSDIPNGLKALDVLPLEGWLQIIAWCGFLETCVNTPQNPREPGNYYRGRFGIAPGYYIPDPELREQKLNAELANGRLAMMAIVGMWFQDGLTGSAWGDWSL